MKGGRGLLHHDPGRKKEISHRIFKRNVERWLLEADKATIEKRWTYRSHIRRLGLA